jgi:hypothetical protein
MPAANDQLRAARERTASPACPDECLSRQELAELANAWIWEHHHTMVALSANYIGQLERGKIRWPGKIYRGALRAILGVSTNAALGFVNARRAVVKLDNVDRQKFLRTSASLGVGTLVLGPIAALLEHTEPTPIPTRVGETEIEQVRTAAQVFQSWDFTYGGGLAREAVMGQLRWSAGLLDATCPDRLRPELFSAVGYLADTAGYMAFDSGAHHDAHHVFRFALTCAEHADDWHLRAHVLSSMAELTIETGQPDEGLTLTEHALVRADRLTATELAMLHTDRTHALAKMRRVRDTLTAVGTADDYFAHSTPVNDPPFMAYYTTVFHPAKTGHALVDLAMLGRDHGKATDRLTEAVAGLTARPLALCLTKLASLTMSTGDPIHAATIGHAALDAAGTIRSHRATGDLRELARHAAPHQHLDDVAHLRHRITTLISTTNP